MKFTSAMTAFGRSALTMMVLVHSQRANSRCASLAARSRRQLFHFAKSIIGGRVMRNHPPDPEMQNPRRDDRHHLARVEQKRNIEALNGFDTSENFHLVKRKLQHRFGLLPPTAAVIAELALFARCS
jgi:hypothetical protein